MGRFGVAAIAFGCVYSFAVQADSAASLSLAGEWEFLLGTDATILPATPLKDRITLPGTVAGNGYGEHFSGKSHSPGHETWGRLFPIFEYAGVAWYARDVDIPNTWAGKELELFLERCHWVSQIWWDGQYIGERNSLSTPHRYVLTQHVTGGRHRLVISINNRYAVNVGMDASALGENSHTNWNGILGALELRSPGRFQVRRMYGELAADSPAARIKVDYTCANPAAAFEVRIAITSDASGKTVGEATWRGKPQRAGIVDIRFPLQDVSLWDEDNPATYTLHAMVVDASESIDESVRAACPFPMRRIHADGRALLLNDEPIYLRGTMDTGVFPLTGNPPLDVSDWMTRLKAVKSFGLNHVRFHSWCPPEAAFTAADALGMYLQVELPANTTVDAKKEREVVEFLTSEARAILREYGNHPSFVLMAMGSQMDGDWNVLDSLVDDLKKEDPRRLYTYTSDHARLEPGPTSDFFVGLGVKDRGRFRRYSAYNGGDLSQPASNYDLDDLLSGVGQPSVYHEIGQWAMYPDWSQIGMYSGMLRPTNLESYRQKEIDAGLAKYGAAFQRASTEFAGLLLKEDIETARRSKRLSGFQWYQLWDLPGLGEVLVGALDALGNPKPGVYESGLKNVLGPVVPLLRAEKFIWTQDEFFRAQVQLSHGGHKPLGPVGLAWRLEDTAMCVVQHGEFEQRDYRGSGLSDVGQIEFSCADLDAPAHFTLRVEAQGPVSFENKWDLWIYPRKPVAITPSDVKVTRDLDEKTMQHLRHGGSVLWIYQVGERAPALRDMRFLPVTKSLSLFTEQPSSMGLLVNAKHPALADFPTDTHADWQWWGPTHAPAAMFSMPNLDEYFEPIVRVIPDFHDPHPACVLMEARVGDGKILACSLPLMDREDDPAAAQLYRSLLAYASSPKFAPTRTVSAEKVYEMLTISGRTK